MSSNGSPTVAKRSPIFASCASWSPTSCELVANCPRMYRQMVANFREMLANVCKACRQTVAKCSPIFASCASWSPTARNSRTPFEHCAQIGSGLHIYTCSILVIQLFVRSCRQHGCIERYQQTIKSSYSRKRQNQLVTIKPRVKTLIHHPFFC